jgi:hypothetical protein
VAVGKVCAVVVRRLAKVPTSATGDGKGRKDGHTFTMTCKALLHHAVEYRTRSDEALVH